MRWLLTVLALAVTVEAHAQLPLSSQPAEVAKRVAARLIEQTDFGFDETIADGRQAGFYHIEMRAPIGKAAGDYVAIGRLQFADSAISDLSRFDLKVSHSAGFGEIWIDGRMVYRAIAAEDQTLREVDYDRIETAVTLRAPLRLGDERIVLKLRPTGTEVRFAIGFARQDGQTEKNAVSITMPVSNPVDASRFLIAGPVDPALVDSPLKMATIARSPLSQPASFRPAPPAAMRLLPKGLGQADWRYFTGAFLLALDDVENAFPTQNFTAFRTRHARYFLNNVELIASERTRGHLIDGPFSHYFRFTLLDDIGPQSAALVDWAARAANAADRRKVDAITNRAVHAMLRVPRLADGTFARVTPVDKTVWADDLFMGAASLARLSLSMKRPDLLDEAARQTRLFDQKLRDPVTGLYWHGWFDREARHSSSKWGRANGWVMLAKSEILLRLPADHPARPALLRSFRQHADALVKVQSQGGLWNQVLDRPDTYLETSASAMFVTAFAEGVTRGWLPAEPFAKAARMGWQGVASQIQLNGDVEGIVRSTPILFSDGEYQKTMPRLNDPRGIGAVLHAAASMARLAAASDRQSLE